MANTPKQVETNETKKTFIPKKGVNSYAKFETCERVLKNGDTFAFKFFTDENKFKFADKYLAALKEKVDALKIKGKTEHIPVRKEIEALHNGYNLIPRELKADRDFAFKAYTKYGVPFENIAKSAPIFTADKTAMLAFINNIPQGSLHNEHPLKFAADNLKADKEVVMASVNKKGFSIQFASEELRNDKELAMAALTGKNGTGFNLRHLSNDLRNDPEIVKTAIENGMKIPENVSSKEVESIRQKTPEATILTYAGEKITSNKEVFDSLNAVAINIKNSRDQLMNQVCPPQVNYAVENLKQIKQSMSMGMK